MKWYIKLLTKSNSLTRQSTVWKECRCFLCSFLRDFTLWTINLLPKEKLPFASFIPDSSATSKDISVCQCLSYSEALPSDPGSSGLISPAHSHWCAVSTNTVQNTLGFDNYITFLTPGNLLVILPGLVSVNQC